MRMDIGLIARSENGWTTLTQLNDELLYGKPIFWNKKKKNLFFTLKKTSFSSRKSVMAC